MRTDGYTPAIPFARLVELARKYGPEELREKAADPDSVLASGKGEICPCVRGEPCVVAALADEFRRLADSFDRQQAQINPCSPPARLEQFGVQVGVSVLKAVKLTHAVYLTYILTTVQYTHH